MMAAVSATVLVSVMGMDMAFAKTVLKGDLDEDSRITLTDVQMTLKGALRIVTLSEQQKIVADVDGDGKVTLADCQKVLKAALRIEDLGYMEDDTNPSPSVPPVETTKPAQPTKPPVTSEEPTGTTKPVETTKPVQPTQPSTSTTPSATDKPSAMEHHLPCSYFEGCEEYFAKMGIEVVTKKLVSATFCYCGEPMNYDEYGNVLSEEEAFVKGMNHSMQHFLNEDLAIIGTVTSTRLIVVRKQ